MFGGHGLYSDGRVFSILYQGRLDLKVDDQNRPDFERRGMGPFRPNERQALKSFCELPRDVQDNPEQLISWAKEAIRAAQA